MIGVVMVARRNGTVVPVEVDDMNMNIGWCG